MEAIKCPFIVAVDTREQMSYGFKGLRANAKYQFRPLEVATERQTLQSGDYAIQGLEDEFQIERKSLADLHHSCSWERENFEKKHQALAQLKRGCVIVEASLDTLATYSPVYRKAGTGEICRSKVRPKTIHRIMLSWYVRYGVPWITAGVGHFKNPVSLEQEFAAEYWRAKRSRRLAEVTCFRLLEKFYQEVTK